MKNPSPGRILLVIFLFLGLVGGASAASSKVSTVPSSDNTFTTTARASNGFNRDFAALKSEAEAAADQYCASLGKKIKVLSSRVDKPFFGMGYAKAEVVFRALDANDPAMNAEVAVTADGRRVLVPMNPVPTAAAPVAAPAPEATTDMYNDLLKLDDLRKRGILTDEEFQAEKKKVLARGQ